MNMNVKTRNGEVELNFYGFASEKIYEDRNNKALDLTEPRASVIIELFYCMTIACLKREKKDIITFDDWFDDIYDLNEGDMTIALFYQWYINQKIAENELLTAKLGENKDKTADKKKS